MAKDEKSADPMHGSNIKKLKEDAQRGVQKINQLKDDRTAINEEIAAVKADLQAKGIHKKALDMAMTYMNMDPDKREGFDVSYDIVREAIGLPVKAQGDLFEGKKEDGSDDE